MENLVISVNFHVPFTCIVQDGTWKFHLNMSNAAGYMEISMYLNMCSAGGYMEIFIYLLHV